MFQKGARREEMVQLSPLLSGKDMLWQKAAQFRSRQNETGMHHGDFQIALTCSGSVAMNAGSAPLTAHTGKNPFQVNEQNV